MSTIRLFGHKTFDLHSLNFYALGFDLEKSRSRNLTTDHAKYTENRSRLVSRADAEALRRTTEYAEYTESRINHGGTETQRLRMEVG